MLSFIKLRNLLICICCLSGCSGTIPTRVSLFSFSHSTNLQTHTEQILNLSCSAVVFCAEPEKKNKKNKETRRLGNFLLTAGDQHPPQCVAGSQAHCELSPGKGVTQSSVTSRYFRSRSDTLCEVLIGGQIWFVSLLHHCA